MKIALIGASGNVGSRLLAEALRRGHMVTAVVRHPEKVPSQPGVTARQGDVNAPETLAPLLAGHDAVISSTRFLDHDPAKLTAAVQQGKPLDGHPVTDPVAQVRRLCRDAFRRQQVLGRLIPLIEEVLSAGGLPLPEAPPEAMPVAFEEPDRLGDAGHRG